ncbi:MAG: hypothetical protein H5T98_08645 [Syntrophomonadaceae bacterium]|nr:hypothetical protein [Syntrophomonadaceae bacterium]
MSMFLLLVIGGGWSTTGADNMARLLAAKADKELSRYVGVSQSIKKEIKQLMPTALVKPDCKPTREDMSRWLAASVPLLGSQAPGKMWVKYVLRPLTSA